MQSYFVDLKISANMIIDKLNQLNVLGTMSS